MCVCVSCEPGEVEADTFVGILRDEVLDDINLLNLHQQVTCLRLSAVLQAVAGDILNELHEGVFWRRLRRPLVRQLRTQTSAGWGDTWKERERSYLGVGGLDRPGSVSDIFEID